MKPQLQTPGIPNAVSAVTSWKAKAWISTAVIGSTFALYGPVPVQIVRSGIDSWRSWTTTGCHFRKASWVALVRASFLWMPSRLLSWKTYCPQYGGVRGPSSSKSVFPFWYR